MFANTVIRNHACASSVAECSSPLSITVLKGVTWCHLKMAELFLVHESPSKKNRLAKNIQVLQVFFLQDFQDLALNLTQILQVLH